MDYTPEILTLVSGIGLVLIFLAAKLSEVVFPETPEDRRVVEEYRRKKREELLKTKKFNERRNDHARTSPHSHDARCPFPRNESRW
jgi:hypothetical protein